MLKFWLSLYYFLGIKLKFITTLYVQINSLTKKQNYIIEIYLQAFVHKNEKN